MKFKIIGSILMLFLLQYGHVFAQSSSSKVIQGSVLSKTDNEALIGAYVLVKDDNNRVLSATITDFNGQFVIQVKNASNILDVSFIGFVTQTLVVGDKSNLTILLEEDSHEIDEVQIIAERRVDDGGSFSIPEREVSTAVQTFNLKDIEGIQSTSIDDVLQGRIAGLDIVANSGDPGAGSSMRIRGTTSINSSSEPLIVVNGIPYETEVDASFDFSNSTQEQYATMLSINPDDIEEIAVLKDAASTAIWGSKGANGVINIKTKRGMRSPTKIQYSYRLTGTVQPKGMNMLNGDDYTMMMKQAYFNSEQDEDKANVREFLYDQSWSEYENFNNNTDWVSEVSQTGFKHDHYLSIYGGGERARYRVAGGYLKQTGTVIGQELNRYSTRSYLDYSVSDRIKFISEFAFTYSDNQKSYTWKENDNWVSILGIAYKKMPNVSVYKQDRFGNNTDEYYNISRDVDSNYESLHEDQRNLRNPIALANLATNRHENYRIIPTFRLHYDLLDPLEQTLKYEMTVSFDVNNDKTTKFLPKEASNAPWDDDGVNLAESSDSESMKTMLDNKITWQPNLSHTHHSLLLQGAFWLNTGTSTKQGGSTTNLPSGATIDPSVQGYITNIESYRSSFRANALTLRGHYTYKKRYVFGFTFRRDGSTKFGESNKFGNFPGVSAKWIISDEAFMQPTSRWLSFLAFRPSWGIGGNQPKSEYLHFSRYSPYGNYMDMPATRPSSLRLDNLKWENTESYNFGLDLGLFDDRLVFDLNYYKKRTKDLLFENTKLPTSSGYSGASWQNVGTMDNTGWEVYCYTNNLVKINDFRVDVNFNLSSTENTIVELRDDILEAYDGDFNYDNGSYLSRLQNGNPFGSIYGFRYKGVYRYNEYVEGSMTPDEAPVARDRDGHVIVNEYGEALPMYFAYGRSNAYEFQGGDAKYEDINHDGSIDELDIVYLGNSNPKLNGGFGTSFYYKSFSVKAFFNFRYGNDIVNEARMYAENMHNLNNQSTAVNWRWRKDGDVTDMPRALYQYGYNWLGSDRFVEDGSFLRFKHLVFAYAVPKKRLEKYNIERLSLSCTLNNLFVWTKYTGVDPEVGYGSFGVSKDNSQTPRSRDCTLGLTLTF